MILRKEKKFHKNVAINMETENLKLISEDTLLKLKH